jgi:transposase
MNEDGLIVDDFIFSNDSDGISALLSKLDSDCKAVVESTGNMWVRICNALEDNGIEVKVANTLMTKAVSSPSIKNDSRSARTLARLLKADLIYECYVPSKEARNARNLLRHRSSLVKMGTMVKNQVHALLDLYEMDKIECKYKDILGTNGLAMLSTLKVNGDDDLILHTQIEHLECIKNCIEKVSARIAMRASDNEYVRILMSMTGIDYHTALLIATEIGDISRFPTPKHLVSWAGLCPSLNDSGESKYYGRMKRRDCNKRVQWAIMQAAHVAAMYDERMKAYHERNARRINRNKAIVKVANKMITIIWHMLMKKQLYMQKNDRLYHNKVNKMGRIAN